MDKAANVEFSSISTEKKRNDPASPVPHFAPMVRLKRAAFIALAAVALSACNGAITKFLDDREWSNRRKLTFDNSAQAENLVNFPVLVRLDASRIDYTKTQDAGQDIRFYDADNTTLLSHEIEKWDEAGTSSVWVKVPQIDAASASDHIYMYYGNARAADAQSATAVWDSNFRGVWHLGATAHDSTANAYNGTNAGAVTLVAGKSGDARSSDGATQYINMSGTTIAANLSAVTLSLWVNRTANVGGQGLMCFSINNGGVATGTSRLAFEVITTTNLNGIVRAPDGAASASFATTSNPLANLNTWYQVTMTIDFSGKIITYYVDGSLNSASAVLGWAPNVTDSTISASAALGAFDDGLVPFRGYTDEIRFSSVVRSAAWIAADYKSTSDSFVSFGAEEIGR